MNNSESIIYIQWGIIASLVVALSSAYVTYQITATDIIQALLYLCGAVFMFRLLGYISNILQIGKK